MAVVKHDSKTDIFRGQLFIFVDGSPIAYGKDASMDITTAEIDISNKMMEDGWEGSLPGKKSYTVSSESLMTQKKDQISFPSLLDKQIEDELLEFYMGETIKKDATADGGEFTMDKSKPHYTGTIMITSLSVKSTDGDIATCSSSFKGVGKLNKGEIVPAP